MARILATLVLVVLTMAASISRTVAQGDAVLMTAAEKRIIAGYFQRQYGVWRATRGVGKATHGALPPGLAKKGTLSPGLAAQLERNGRLPPGVTKHELPDDLLAQLQPRPAGYEFIVVDDRVLLIQSATDLILDILTVAAADAG
jgi:Ni/Co efflux regulator RcnB